MLALNKIACKMLFYAPAKVVNASKSIKNASKK